MILDTIGGHQLYAYAPNPVSWIDPLGWMNLTGKTKSGTPRLSKKWRARNGPAAMRKHHLIPQAMMDDPRFMNQMKVAGIANPSTYIHRQVVRIPNITHMDIHDAGWNRSFKDWFERNRNFSKRSLQKNLSTMMKKYKIPKSSRTYMRRYGRKC